MAQIFKRNQFLSFGIQHREKFYKSLSAELQEFIGKINPNLATKERDELIRHAFMICKKNGFSTEKQVTKLSYILVAFPKDFASFKKYEWLNALLCAKSSADRRLAQIQACIRVGRE